MAFNNEPRYIKTYIMHQRNYMQILDPQMTVQTLQNGAILRNARRHAFVRITVVLKNVNSTSRPKAVWMAPLESGTLHPLIGSLYWKVSTYCHQDICI